MHTFIPVSRPPKTWTQNDLIEHVKTGMRVELGTIPLYFCALYSIKRDNGKWGSKARANILAVAEQEMLHLALAGNMLHALGGRQSLYDKSFIPTYPSEILFDKIEMELRPADKKNLECFLKIEAPYMPPPPPSPSDIQPSTVMMDVPNLLTEYQSIGEFYEELKNGIYQLSRKIPGLFSKNKEKQFTGEEFFDKSMTVVVDRETALQALETIVDQGEGSVGVPDSHYSIFLDLYQRRMEWECIDYIDNPKTAAYAEKNKVAYHLLRFKLSLGLDASFCYLLQTIDRCWVESCPLKRKQLFRNIHRIMIEILSPVAHLLVEQVIEGEKHAAPCFEFYVAPQKEQPSSPEESSSSEEELSSSEEELSSPEEEEPMSPDELFRGLRGELVAAHTEAMKDPGSPATREGIAKIMFCLEGLEP